MMVRQCRWRRGAGGDGGEWWERRRWGCWSYPDPAPIATTASDSAMADCVGSSKAYLKTGSAKIEPPPPSNPSKPPTASPRPAPAGLVGAIGGAAASRIGGAAASASNASSTSSTSVGAAARRLAGTAGTRRWWQTRAGSGAAWRATSASHSRRAIPITSKTPRAATQEDQRLKSKTSIFGLCEIRCGNGSLNGWPAELAVGGDATHDAKRGTLPRSRGSAGAAAAGTKRDGGRAAAGHHRCTAPRATSPTPFTATYHTRLTPTTPLR